MYFLFTLFRQHILNNYEALLEMIFFLYVY